MKKFLLILLTVLILFSCGRPAYQEGYADDAVYVSKSAALSTWNGAGFYEGETPPAYKDMSNIYEDSGTDRQRSDSPAANVPETYERKLVKRASLRMRVDNLDTADNSINELLRQYNAYAASTSIEENSHYYSLRVPSQYYDVFLSSVDGIGRLLNRNETTEDVTLRYYDLEGRLATRQELLKTYQSYLGRAVNIEEMLAVEAKISELQYDIEKTGTQLRNLANLVDYATIELRILGPVASAPGQRSLTFGERFKQLFSGYSGFFSSIAVGAVGFIIYGIPILILLVLLYWLLFGKIGLARKLWSAVKK